MVFWRPKQSKVVGKVGYTSAPVGPSGDLAQWFFVSGLAINKDISEEKKGAAWLFLQWRSSKDVFFKEIALENPRFTIPSTAVITSEEWKKQAEKSGLAEYVMALSETCLTMDPWYWPFVPEYIQVGEAFATNVSMAIAGEVTVKEALKNANIQIEQIMQNAGYY